MNFTSILPQHSLQHKFLSAFLTFVVLVDPAAEKDVDIQYVSSSNVNAKSGPNKIYVVKNVEEVLK